MQRIKVPIALVQSRIAACRKWDHASHSILSLVPVPSPGLRKRIGAYIAVDQYWRLYFDPDWMEGRDEDSNVASILHEVMHLLAKHFVRGQRYVAPDDEAGWRMWNWAADMAVWSVIALTDLPIPETAVTAEKHGFKPGLSAEQYFKLLRNKQQQQQQEAEEKRKQQQAAAEEQDEDEDEDEDKDEDDDNQSQGDGDDTEQDSSGESEGEEQGSGSDDRSAGDEDDGTDTAGEDDNAEPDAGSGEGSDAGGSQGDAGSEPHGNDDDSGEQSEDGGDSAGQGDSGSQRGSHSAGDEDSGQSGQDEAGLGSGSCSDGRQRSWELPPPDATDSASEDNVPGVEEWQQEVLREHTAKKLEAKGWGTGHGWSEVCDDFIEPKLDPRRLLQDAITKAVSSITNGSGKFTYRRPARRPSPFGTLRPRNFQPVPKILVIIDTSGSMSPHEMAQGAGLVAKCLNALHMRDGVHVICGDERVAWEEQIFDPRKIEKKGRGGTDMAGIMEYACAKKPHERPELIVCVTDGETPWPRERLPVPIVAAITRESVWATGAPAWIRTINLY